jgi:hypothetical protein
VRAAPRRYIELALGFQHACVRLSDRTIRCWGYNGDGRMMAGGCCYQSLCGVPEGTACGAPSAGMGTCSDGWCSGCGGLNQPCCDRARPPGQRCREASPLCLNEKCVACGGLGEPCCEGTSRCRDSAVCFYDRCAMPGQPGAPCLPGNACAAGCCVLQGHGDYVCLDVGGACPGDAGSCSPQASCGACGGQDQPCCRSESTRIPFYCSAPGVSCGDAGLCEPM